MPATRDDLVLVLAAGAEGGPFPFDPVRLMKACFVAAEEGRDEWRDFFAFRPYDYGPFDSGVYASRDALIFRGLLERARVGRYDSYRLTDEGRALLDEVEEDLGERDSRWLRSVGAWVASKSFARLLDDVYDRWPDYATRSVYRSA